MRAKFIKNNNPRKTLGLDPLEKRYFRDRYDLEDWLIRVFIPDYYGTSNFVDIAEKIKEESQTEYNQLHYLPENLYRKIVEMLREIEGYSDETKGVVTISALSILEKIEKISGVKILD